MSTSIYVGHLPFSATAATAALHEQDFDGRNLTVNHAKPHQERPRQPHWCNPGRVVQVRRSSPPRTRDCCG
jgi:hypothetical protein